MKRIDELQPLSRDHHQALVLANHCRQVANSSSIADSIRLWGSVKEAFNNDLLPHFELEERTLIEPLKRLGEEQLLFQLLDEHQRLMACVTSTSKPERDLLMEFADLLTNHVRFEERELFARIQHRLTREEKAALIAA